MASRVSETDTSALPRPLPRATSRAKRILRSFGYAFEGLGLMVRTQPNFLIHLSVATLVLVVAVALHLSSVEVAVVILTIAFVLVLECVNTGLETLCDVVSPGYHPLIKRAKDIAAAAVLIGAIASVTIGVLLFGPHLAAMVK